MDEPRVSILLATYNGEKYLEEQLDSIFNQTHKNHIVLASDDGSNDRTISIMKRYNLTIFNSPRKGFAANFLSLIAQANEDSSYYAYADQDDVWDSNKLSRAIDLLAMIPQGIPALYCGRTHLVDEGLISQGNSPLFKKKPGFKNALVQNIAGGNTMVFNAAAFSLLRNTLNECVVSHDWWTYLLITGAGGRVIYDSIPFIHYRQHRANLVGANIALTSRLHRIRKLFAGQFRSWINLNNQGLRNVSHLLTSENKQILEQFDRARHSGFIGRLIKIKKIGLYRQTLLGQLALTLALIFNKI